MHLPPTVRVTAAEEVGDEFHARFRAVSKTYRYRIWNADVVSPFERSYVWHVAAPRLDVEAMADAAARLVGRHDFAAFQGIGSDPESTVRTIERSLVSESNGFGESTVIVYEVRGDGFLRHMVRTIAGTLVEVGRGRRSPGWIEEVLAPLKRHRAGRTAPPTGLFLVEVSY
jgi:tRNA pseudouridine38-40 synthase